MSLGGKQVQFSDVLSRTKQEIIDSLIERDLDALGRDSYTDIFETLRKRFSLESLTNFPSWKRFVEFSQRRNLLTHCEGQVSQQYQEVCKSVGCEKESKTPIGTKLEISEEYLLGAIDVVTEVAVKLGQTLWRKACKKSIHSADDHLGNAMFELLKREKWDIVLCLGEYGHVIASLKGLPVRHESSTRIILLNHAQAAKWSGDNVKSVAILGSVDWSGSIPEFQMAVDSLLGNWDNAAELMKRVGGTSKIFPPHGYVGWPIFREFRTTAQFSSAFESIFGVTFDSAVENTPRIQNGDGKMPVDPDRK